MITSVIAIPAISKIVRTRRQRLRSGSRNMGLAMPVSDFIVHAAIHIVTIRHKLWFYPASALLGMALRLYFALDFAVISGDTLIYADIAKNWLHHGMLAITDTGVPVPELIR